MAAYQTGGSSTSVVELDEIKTPQQPHSKESIPSINRQLSHASSQRNRSLKDEDVNDGALPSPTTATEQLQRWNHPRKNTFRTFATFWGFVIMGANDAAVGALIPYLEEYYHLTYTIVALVFLSPLFGYVASALLNPMIHDKLGQRGVGIIAGACHLIAYVAAAVHPPFPVIVVFFILAGFGNGLADAGWNAWVGNMANANEVLGFLHACYGLGATIAPFIATTMITKGHLPWYYFYYIMVGAAGVEVLFSAWAFWEASGAEYRAAHPRTSGAKGNRMKEALWGPASRVTWLCALFLAGYVGVEVALGGWITTFMLRVRHGSPFASGMTATGFWLGMTVGRVVLGFVTPRIGESLAILIYLPICMGLELLFWLVPQFYVSAVAIAIQGAFLGPLFPAAVLAVSRLLPKHLHVSSIGFAAAFGGGGAAVFPFAVGAIAQAKGVQVLQPIALALLAVIWLLWFGLPKMPKKRD
ncbi:MFS general substrate transporter [Tothia fuscella]|uniref:MFS general substrate transporter n=1 Tax=Tothia fuscella TaxID=1048955 RepID=A0A9P4NPA6_9PEZI|nr:MFS general substrate transporter [Tothia fuscella]